MTASTADYYGILGLTSDATLADVKKAYRKLARQHHLKDNVQATATAGPARPPPRGATPACQAGTPMPPAAC